MDSKAVVNCVLDSQFRPPWCVLTEWYNCKYKMEHMQVYVSHIYREGNQVADQLSKLGLNFPNLKWWTSFPPQIAHQIGRDHDSRPNYRFT